MYSAHGYEGASLRRISNPYRGRLPAERAKAPSSTDERRETASTPDAAIRRSARRGDASSPYVEGSGPLVAIREPPYWLPMPMLRPTSSEVARVTLGGSRAM